MADDLDSFVKGAPLLPRSETPKRAGGDAGSPAAGAESNNPTATTATTATSSPTKAGDPLSYAPSSPSMIYLNLLILEASLRAQYLELRARRRHHTFFLALLALWTTGFGYALFLAPREDGSGVGGSVYWVVDVTEKVCFMGGIITAALVWGTGIWERGIRWPRRWFAVSNRGLRGFNCKLVALKRPWWAEALATAAWFLTYGLFSGSGGGGASSYRFVEEATLREVDRELRLTSSNHPVLPIVNEDEERGGHDEDLAPGGDYVKLLLLAKPFSPTFRENWELYRTEYWERENERRALIRAKLKERDRQLLRQTGGWFWWLPGRRVPDVAVTAAAADHHHHVHAHQKPHHHATSSSTSQLSEKPHHNKHISVEREHKRTRSSSVRRGSMSGTGTSSSRSPTPTLEMEESAGGGGGGSSSGGGNSSVARKLSTASTASDKRRKKVASVGGGGASPARTPKRPGGDSRSVTPENPSPLAKESSFGSAASSGSGTA